MLHSVHPKVTASASGVPLGGAITVIVVWLLSLTNINPPANVQEALGVIISTLTAFLAGYLTPSLLPAQEQTQPKGQ